MAGGGPTADHQPPVDEVLRTGAMEVEGRFAESSNATLLVTCELHGVQLRGVYKPQRGERQLWDFPPGLDRREMAAYLVSELLGWGLVPTTVLRDEAPFGPGSVQLFVDDDGESHYFTLREEPSHLEPLQRIAVLDVVVNNADRKSGHVILADRRIWAIDHGLCFHHEAKLRTVIWDFAGEPVPEPMLDDLAHQVETLGGALGDLLTGEERAALTRRTRNLLRSGHFPVPKERDGWPPYPWPLV